MNVDGKRLLLLGALAALALAVLARIDRPRAAAEPGAAVGLVETLVDGVPFSKVEFRPGEVQVRLLDNPGRRPLSSVAREADAIAAWNGGFYERDFSPSGLLVQDGEERSALTERGGSGIWILSGGRSSIVPRAEYRSRRPPDLAVQCGPILVEPGGVMGIASDRPPTAARTAICVERGKTSVWVTWERITLHRLARILRGQRCRAALNLDGGPSTGLYFAGRVGHEPSQPVRTVIALSSQ